MPTKEEFQKVREKLFEEIPNIYNKIDIISGRAEKTNLPNVFCDYLVCNSVLHGSGQTLKDVDLALKEFSRIIKYSGTLYVGEMPDCDELKNKNYGNSLIAWLLFLLKTDGLRAFNTGLKKIIVCLLTKEPFVISPKFMFFMRPSQFSALLKKNGFKVIKVSRHYDVDRLGKIVESKTRWNYLAVKENKNGFT